MSDDLFPSAVSQSPRLKWLAEHGLLTREDELPRMGIGPRKTMPFVCLNSDKTVATFGETEDEATERMAALLNLKHWKLEGFEKAGAVVAPTTTVWED